MPVCRVLRLARRGNRFSMFDRLAMGGKYCAAGAMILLAALRFSDSFAAPESLLGLVSAWAIFIFFIASFAFSLKGFRRGIARGKVFCGRDGACT